MDNLGHIYFPERDSFPACPSLYLLLPVRAVSGLGYILYAHDNSKFGDHYLICFHALQKAISHTRGWDSADKYSTYSRSSVNILSFNMYDN